MKVGLGPYCTFNSFELEQINNGELTTLPCTNLLFRATTGRPEAGG